MTVLVTGGAGFIGSSIAKTLQAAGRDVVVLDNLIAGNREAVPEGTTFVEADIRDLDALRSAFDGVEVVIHQAALRSVPRSVEEPHLVNETNVTGTLNVLIAAEETGVRKVVYASSSSGYGGIAEHGQMSRETDPTLPRSPYAVSKLAGEHYCRVWTEVKGLATVSLRYFNVFGPGQAADSKYAAVFPAFVSALARGEAPEIHWDGEQSRDFTYIDDVVAANIAAMDAGPDADGHVFNVASGDPKTINDVYRSLCEVTGVDIDPTYVPKRTGDIRHSYADISAAKALLGWEPRAEWKAAVRSTVEWFQD